MFGLFKRTSKSTDKSQETDAPAQAAGQTAPAVSAASPDGESAPTPPEKRSADTDETLQPAAERTGFFGRLRQRLSKTRRGFTDALGALISGKKKIDDELLEELEMILLAADVGVEATDRIIRNLTEQVSRKTLKDPESLMAALRQQLLDILRPVSQPLTLSEQDRPFVILMVGVNGVGKTTTIGKLAARFKAEGKKVMLAAGDTFRAAAVEQLQSWGERNDVPVIAQHDGADSAAVIFDALQSARARGVDVLIADTAGRLHTQANLMEELKKIKRVMAKLDETAPHEIMLVLDASTGQNAVNQARLFHETVGLTGITLTKLDGTAKGGVLIALSERFGVPIRFIGVGESVDDLQPFDAETFVDALFE